MWVVKLGGSWITNSKLGILIKLLSNFSDVPLIVVVGGGIFVDAIRSAQKHIPFDDDLAHDLAVEATQFYAKIIKNVNPNINLITDFKKTPSKVALNILLARDFLKKYLGVEKKWDSTSDSIACWVSKKINAKGVLFIKSIKVSENLAVSFQELQKEGILDKNVLNYISKEKNYKIVGPEIVNLLSSKKTWSKVLEKILDIKT